MPLPNGQIGIVINPIAQSPFIQQQAGSLNSPPPGTDFRITNSDDIRITNEGDSRITN